MMRIFSLMVFLHGQLANAEEKLEYIIPESEVLKTGRLIWVSNCAACHGYGIADAPSLCSQETGSIAW